MKRALVVIKDELQSHAITSNGKRVTESILEHINRYMLYSHLQESLTLFRVAVPPPIHLKDPRSENETYFITFNCTQRLSNLLNWSARAQQPLTSYRDVLRNVLDPLHRAETSAIQVPFSGRKSLSFSMTNSNSSKVSRAERTSYAERCCCPRCSA